MQADRQKLFFKKYENGDFPKVVYWVIVPNSSLPVCKRIIDAHILQCHFVVLQKSH